MQADVDRARLLAPPLRPPGDGHPRADEAANLLEALHSNRRIGIAVGVLMAHRGLTGAQVFDVLRYVTHTSNRTLQDVAAEVAGSAADPELGTSA